MHSPDIFKGLDVHLPGPLHEEAVDVGALPGRRGDLLLVLLGDLAHQRHLVQRQLVLPRRALHDGRQERLRVEEPRQPHGRRHAARQTDGSPSPVRLSHLIQTRQILLLLDRIVDPTKAE